MKLKFYFGLPIASALIAAGCSQSPSSVSPVVPANRVAAETGTPTSSPRTPAPEPVKPPFERPPLVSHRGNYFTWEMPADWTSHESTNGVDMVSADGTLIANSFLLMGSLGSSDPWRFLTSTLAAIGMRDLKGISSMDQPSQPS